jgi:catechol 2,3-dioxygenase-like lactoylglutathione lyase family enzyme
MSLLGTINHVSLTVSNLDEAIEFFDPWLDFLGYTDRERGNHAGTRMAINIHPEHGT